MSDDNNSSSFPTFTILAAVFVILKLAGVQWFATASWWYVPLVWLGVPLTWLFLVFAFMILVAGVMRFTAWWDER